MCRLSARGVRAKRWDLPCMRADATKVESACETILGSSDMQRTDLIA